ncbi:MAG TPA: BTAD domain-containing putative transcriptional regulator [Acidimicrobiales bacterium]|nr:BTAD domain-containing putative transcriptional regulator [Acidimicrobiales bacterium]
MYCLPPYHVPRPRLVEACTAHPVVVAEAAGGYGKSVLGAELVAAWCAVGIEVQLDHPGTEAKLFASRLRAAVLEAGFTGAAATAMESGSDPTAAVDAVVSALAKERCAFVIYDAHNAAPDAAALIEHMASRLRPGQRLVVLARNLPQGAERLRRAEYFQLVASDLSLDVDETLELCRSGFGLAVSADGARALAGATGGWTAATVLALARAARTGETAEHIAATAVVHGQSAGAVAAILGEALATLGKPGAAKLAQVARLPLLDNEVADAAVGEEGFFQRALHAGAPFAPGRGQWWDLPGPVRDHLATLSPVNSTAMRRAAEDYRRRGELGVAVQLLLQFGLVGDAASLLIETTPEETEALDGLVLQAIFDQMPEDVVDANPRLLMVVARGHGREFQYARRAELLERADRLANRTGDAVLARWVTCERLNDLSRQLAYEECITSARHLLETAGPEESYTRARAYQFLGIALTARRGDGHLYEAALAEAEDCFARAYDLYRSAGMRSALAVVVPYWAMLVEFARGQAAQAMARIEEAMSQVADRPRRWAYLMVWRAWLAAELGLDDLCQASAAEVFRVAEELDSDTLWSQGHWKLAILVSYRGDAATTLHHLRQAEARKGSWWGPGSGDFLAQAADLLDRVGHVPLAREYLGRVKAEPKDAGHLVKLAEAALEARHGDPLSAEALLTGLAEAPIDPCEYWRVTLLRAYAAFRRGEDTKAGTLAAQSFEQAARLGQHELPLIRERALTEQLIGLAIATGQPAALALKATSLPVALAVLGRFELTVAGRPLALGFGQEARLLKLVATSGGQLHSEQAIETLWPEVGRAAGRHRLRTVLNRLRRLAGDVVLRQGEMLAVNEAVRVDLDDFLEEAARARALASSGSEMAAAIAKGAMAIYRGEVLPEDRYEDWAEKARQKARVAMLELLDLCAGDAAKRGDLDELRRTVERTIELAPYDDVRYLRAAGALLQQGRRGEALSVVDRARSAFAEIGLEPPPPLLDLERSIVA